MTNTPPEADGMEQAKWILDHIPHGFDAEEPAVQLIARALTAYGDQRAREARDSLREQGYCMVCGVYHRVGACEAVENARREARAAAIEEAAQLCDDAFRDGRLDREYACETADELAARIRALADTPPQSD